MIDLKLCLNALRGLVEWSSHMHPFTDIAASWAAPVAIVVGVFLAWRFWRNEDVQEHRTALLVCFGVIGMAFIGAAYLGGVWLGIGAACTTALIFAKRIDRVIGDFIGGFVFDLVMGEGSFGATQRARKHLPNLALLRHWRENKMTGKAYRAARRSLMHEARTFGHWLFAAETAALYLDRFGTAQRLIKRLCCSKAFPDYQKQYAAQSLAAWAAQKGRKVDPNAFFAGGVKSPTSVSGRAALLRSEGRPGAAITILRKELRNNPENLTAAFQLVSMLTEDLDDFTEAERIVTVLERQPYTPGEFVEYAQRTIEENRNRGKKIRLLNQRPATEVVGPQLDSGGYSGVNDNTRHDTTIFAQPSDDLVLKELIEKNCIGSAVERLEKGLEQFSEDFKGWMLLLDLLMNRCHQRNSANQVLRRIMQNPKITPEQAAEAEAQMREWGRKAAESDFR